MEKEMKFSKRLKELRLQRGYTQLDLANKLNLKPNTISNYENGKSYPDLDRINELANILNVKTEELLYDIQDQTNEIINDNKQLFVDFKKGKSFEELQEEYNFVVDGKALPPESIKRVLELLELEHFRNTRKRS